MFVRQTGSHPNVKDLTPWFVTYSAVLALDVLLLINYSLHIFLPISNFLRVGWSFVIWVLCAPFIAPIMGFFAAYLGNVRMMQTSSKFHSYTIIFNIPLSIIICLIQEDDPVFLLEFVFMIFVKIALSAVSSKIRQYLMNPRFASNDIKLKKILSKQGQKIQKSQEIIGRQTLNQIRSSIDNSFDSERNESLEV